MGTLKESPWLQEASSETGSDVKTQGRDQEKPLRQRISCCFAGHIDGAIEARMGRGPPAMKELQRLMTCRHIEIIFQRDALEGRYGVDAQVPATGKR
jgi:hypothetical protein